MDASPDITLHLPAEHLLALSEVIYAGLQRAKLDNKTRTELTTWWQAEQEFLNDEIEAHKEKS
jgi:hypothetical protein